MGLFLVRDQVWGGSLYAFDTGQSGNEYACSAPASLGFLRLIPLTAPLKMTAHGHLRIRAARHVRAPLPCLVTACLKAGADALVLAQPTMTKGNDPLAGRWSRGPVRGASSRPLCFALFAAWVRRRFLLTPQLGNSFTYARS